MTVSSENEWNLKLVSLTLRLETRLSFLFAMAFLRRVQGSLVRRWMPLRSMATVRYRKRGDPASVLRLEDDDDAGELGPTEVAVRMLFAPINPSDINQVEGSYGVLPPLPAVGGNEGVGEITAVGSAATRFAVGDWAVPMPASGFGTWRTVAKADEAMLQKCPSDIPAEYAATIGVNPCTAYRLLRDFETLHEGDTVIQNGANSQVGVAIIQMARDMGVRTINVVRERPPGDDTVELLKSLGADVVVTPSVLGNPEAFSRAVEGLALPKLGLNCTGGSIATSVALALDDGGVLVSYGGMSLRPIAIPGDVLQDRGLRCDGFWVTRWAQEHSREEREAMIGDVAEMVKSGKFRSFLERHPFSRFAEAMKVARAPFRSRKVLLDMSR
ncbi:unnamed protein product [Ascophyllum nodosum]